MLSFMLDCLKAMIILGSIIGIVGLLCLFLWCQKGEFILYCVFLSGVTYGDRIEYRHCCLCLGISFKWNNVWASKSGWMSQGERWTMWAWCIVCHHQNGGNCYLMFWWFDKHRGRFEGTWFSARVWWFDKHRVLVNVPRSQLRFVDLTNTGTLWMYLVLRSICPLTFSWRKYKKLVHSLQQRQRRQILQTMTWPLGWWPFYTRTISP